MTASVSTKENIQKVKSFRKIRLFLVFLMGSFIYWMFQSLSEVYVKTVPVEVSYQLDHPKYFLQESPTHTLKVYVKSSGFKAIYYKFFPPKMSLQTSQFVNLNDFTYYILLNKQNDFMKKQLKQMDVVNFEMDTLKIKLGENKSKKVPIVYKTRLHYKTGYRLKEPLVFSNDSIEILGPEMKLHAIDYLETDTLVCNYIDRDFKKYIHLELPSSTIAPTFDSVFISGKVARYSENSIQVPISIKTKFTVNKIKIFPERITIYYQFSMQEVEQVSIDDFEVEVDMTQSEYITDKQELLTLSLVKKPNFVSAYRLEPAYVQYFIVQDDR